jgi:hypothetical protein
MADAIDIDDSGSDSSDGGMRIIEGGSDDSDNSQGSILRNSNPAENFTDKF